MQSYVKHVFYIKKNILIMFNVLNKFVDVLRLGFYNAVYNVYI